MEGIEKAFDFGSSFGSINLLPDLDFFNIKRKMVNDQNRKLIRASIAFDKILSAIDSIDKELPIILNQNPNIKNKKRILRFAKKNISNQFYKKKKESCERYIELFEKEFNDRLIDTNILMSFNSKIKLVFVDEIKGMVKMLNHTLHVKKLEMIKSGKLIEDLD